MKCPEHAGSRVKLDGTYGKPGHRRQRYKCMPRRGKPHVFTELLPREESWHGACEHCERHLDRREGPKAPRNYHFVARGIAEALLAVGAGATYMQASRVARDRARRFRVDSETGELRESDHGQLVADWVELFAPVVFEPHRPAFWPPEGSLLLDHLPFRVRALDAYGKRIPAGRVAFNVFCAVGFQAGKPRLWRAEAFTSAHPVNWSAFLAALPGAPKRIVCDAHGGMLRAIEERWPDAELHQCEWHLHALERLLAKEVRHSPSEELEELRGRAHRPLFLARLRWRREGRREREPRLLDRSQQPDHREAVRPPRGVLRAPGGHAAHHGGAGAAREADHSRALPAPLRAQEPRAAQPAPDAPTAARQRPRRRAELHEDDPLLA